MPGATVRRGERVTLRVAEPEDARFLQRASAEPDLRVPLGSRVRSTETYDLGDERGGDDRFVVCLDDTDTDTDTNADTNTGTDADGAETTRIGQVSVEDASYKRPELGFWIAPERQGEGYGREAVAEAVDYVFNTYPTPAVGAHAFVFNEVSRDLLESLGFREEGRMRRYTYVDGEHRDAVMYGLLREDWTG